MSEAMNLDPTPVEIEVNIGEKKYTLKEATGEVASKYRTYVMVNARSNEYKPAAGEIDIYLLSMCLFDDQGKAVSTATLKTWPARVLKPLFLKAQEIGNLNLSAPKDEDEKEAETKNS